MAEINNNTQKLLEKRYLLRDENGNLLEHTWEDICKRVSKNISSVEIDNTYWEKIFFEKLNEMEFICSSPCLFNAGTQSQQLSSCFVLDIEDNIESIFNTIAECAKIFQRCGGAGFSMNKIRPKGEICKSSGSNASGVVSFMTIFNEVVNQVKQGNKRNGALKIDLPVSHPDIFDFIHCKDDINKLNNMNISVSLTSDFIYAVENDLNWELKFNNKIYKTVKSKDLWNEIINSAHATGEPGTSYQTNMNNGNMNNHINMEVYGNPCHEFVNIPYSSCNLASVNLPKIIENGKINHDKLKENIEITFRFLDDMISVNKLPLEKIQNMTNDIRPVGLGTMGLANLLYELKIPYNSQRGLDFIDELYKEIHDYALNINNKLAKEKGTYPLWKNSRWDKEENIEVRCSSMLSIAPNGSIAFIANIPGGIEPEFALVYQRLTNDGDKYYIVNSVFEKYLKDNNLYTEEILEKIKNNKGSIKGLDDIFSKSVQKIFVTSNDISSEWHVKILAQIQKWVDLSISKTVNLPSNATKEDVGEIYLMAGKLGIKGLTVYRDGSREDQVLSVTDNVNATETVNQIKFNSIQPISRKKLGKTYGTTVDKRSACGKLFITINRDKEGNIVESFVNTSKSGICKSTIDGINRMISIGLRSGTKVEEIIDQLKGISCKACVKKAKGEIDGISCPDIIGRTLEEEYNDNIMVKENIIHTNENKEFQEKFNCPECGSKLNAIEGCISCKNCGYSKCN